MLLLLYKIMGVNGCNYSPLGTVALTNLLKSLLLCLYFIPTAMCMGMKNQLSEQTQTKVILPKNL